MVLDGAAFLSSLTAVSQLQCLDLAQELHGAFVIKNLAVLPVMMLIAVIVTYSGVGHLVPAVEIAKLMVKRDDRLSITVLVMKRPPLDTKIN
ncbi:hypothetical protein D5086_028733, partial [Populus alba]